MRAFLRALPLIVIAALFLLSVWLLQGCAGIYAEAALVHQSHPDAGPGPWPIGGGELETTINGVEGVVGWESGPWFAATGVMYNLRERNLQGGPWTVTLRTGVRLRAPPRVIPHPSDMFLVEPDMRRMPTSVNPWDLLEKEREKP